MIGGERWATFDCYGTLIDWDGGVRASLALLWPNEDAAELLATYHGLEPRLQAGGERTYREVLTEIVPAIAAEHGIDVPAGRGQELADSLPRWEPFAEVRASLAQLRDEGWRIGILSNTDPDYLDASLARIGVEVDVKVVASDIGSYKPAIDHWETFFRRSGADRARHVHVAASLYHDVAPCAVLGLPCVWINRTGESSDLPRAGELPDLTTLLETLLRLVPE